MKVYSIKQPPKARVAERAEDSGGNNPSEADSSDIEELFPATLNRELAGSNVPGEVLGGLVEHGAALHWLDAQGFVWTASFLSDVTQAHAESRLQALLDGHVRQTFDQRADDFLRSVDQGRRMTDADVRRFAARMVIGADGRLNLTCAGLLAEPLRRCEAKLGLMLNVIRLRLEQFVRDPALVALFDSIGHDERGDVSIHPDALALLKSDRQTPGRSDLTPRECGQILFAACVWPQRQGAVGNCSMIGPQLGVYRDEPALLLTELKSLVERGAVSMVSAGQVFELRIPCAVPLTNENLQTFQVDPRAIESDASAAADELLKQHPELARTLDSLCNEPLGSMVHRKLLSAALRRLLDDALLRPEKGGQMSVSSWDCCLAAIADRHDVSMATLRAIMQRPLTSTHPIAAFLRVDVERCRLALVSSGQSVLSSAWCNVFSAGADSKLRTALCEAMVAEMLPLSLADGWTNGRVARERLTAMLLQHLQLLHCEDVGGMGLFVCAPGMQGLGLRIRTPESFKDAVLSLVEEWGAPQTLRDDLISPAPPRDMVSEVRQRCTEPAFASRVNGRLDGRKFAAPWTVKEAVASTRHLVVDGVRHLLPFERRQGLLELSPEALVETLVRVSSERRMRLDDCADVQRHCASLDVASRTHRFTILYGLPSWDAIRDSRLPAATWFEKHMLAPGRAWRDRAWNAEEWQATIDNLKGVIPNHDPVADRAFILNNGGEKSPRQLIDTVVKMIFKREGEFSPAYERLRLVIGMARKAPVFVLGDTNWKNAPLLCIFYDAVADECRYTLASDVLDMAPPEDVSGLPRATRLTYKESFINSLELVDL